MSRMFSDVALESNYERRPRPEYDAAVTPNAVTSSTSTSTAIPNHRTLMKGP